jgi:hypothetical protein
MRTLKAALWSSLLAGILLVFALYYWLQAPQPAPRVSVRLMSLTNTPSGDLAVFVITNEGVQPVTLWGSCKIKIRPPPSGPASPDTVGPDFRDKTIAGQSSITVKLSQPPGNVLRVQFFGSASDARGRVRDRLAGSGIRFGLPAARVFTAESGWVER